jgi:hypothetical protein
MAAKNVIVFSCDPTCTPDVHKKKLKPGTFLLLVADGTDVTLTFATSPFVPAVTTVNIPSNTFVKKRLRTTEGTFRYSVACGNCRSRHDDPSMILEL